MVRPPAEFVEAAKDYVCVRVLDMAGVDLGVFRFDYDLTFAALLMNGDGTIYRQYGGRDGGPAEARLSIASLVRAMKETLADHEEYGKSPRPPKPAPVRAIEQIPAMARQIKAGKAPKCFHCHMVNESERRTAQDAKRWSRDSIWLWPDPARVGLALDPADQTLVKEIAARSPAAAAGLRAGDRLARVGGRRVRTIADVQWVLEETPFAGGTLPLAWERGGEAKEGKVALRPGWRVGSPLDLSWRASMWGLSPKPGFGGPRLSPEDVAKAGLPAGAFAFRVQYIVDWGDEAHTGRNAAKAGIKKGDLVLSAAAKADFESELHFQAWFRLTQQAGKTCEIEVLRGGKREKIRLPVVE
ncbi:MAG: PDZ domain-containing protein [Planctomycetales bacterium]|nr:PDZ domain-containing protein [Planctomycetales bacterium]